MKILYGIQPSGKIHIGNYLSGINTLIGMQDTHDVTFLIADYHALTTKRRKDVNVLMLKLEEDLHRIGAKNVIFQKPENCELAWEIMTITPLSDLNRMTQFKGKVSPNVGLLAYPCLMAADIIMSGAEIVFIGNDQRQHMEFYRRTCRRLKNKNIARSNISKVRVMSIKDSTKKMSKSLGDDHCLYLFDEKENLRKIMKAPTTLEGIKNLRNISKCLGIKYNSKNHKLSKEAIVKKISEIEK